MLLMVFNSLVNCTTSMFAFVIAFFFMSTIEISIRCKIWVSKVFYIAMKSYDLQQLSFILLLEYTGVTLGYFCIA
jgi:hypothetical protein